MTDFETTKEIKKYSVKYRYLHILINNKYAYYIIEFLYFV